jgi:cytochrome c oxidase subunit 2
MEIHPYEKAWLGVSMLLIVAWIGTIVFGAVGLGIQMVDDSGGTVDPALIADGDYDAVENFEEPGVRTTDDGVEVYVVSAKFAFQPGTSEPIEVPADRPVTFHVTSSDVTHGFEIPGTNVNTMVIPGQVAELTVEFDEARQYGIVCNEYCGAGHHGMEGSIRVVQPSEFEGVNA